MASFFILFPFFLLVILVPKWEKYHASLNRIWVKIYFPLIFVPLYIRYEAKLDPSKNYIFAPNHFSYLDIPIMGVAPTHYKFVGKNSMESIPLFGYMYKKLHITVDRASLASKKRTMERARHALDKGQSLIIFPEGGILSKHPPQLSAPKNGAFKLALEKQISIVPVTIPFNWIFLPDGSTKATRRSLKVIFHKPIEIDPKESVNMEELKNKWVQVITNELKKELNSTK